MANKRRSAMTPKAGPTLNDRKRTFSKGGKKTKAKKYSCGGKLGK